VSNFTLTTPVAFFIFNRPDTTAQVFEQIRQARPQKLLVIADGPRPDRPDDSEACAATRAILDDVDWDCDIITRFADTNLGCKDCVASGLDWVFATVDEAIVLEHDTLPHPTFFRYCQELLAKYRDDERFMMLSGCNFQFGGNQTEHSYYFSPYIHCWGWATWRRAWQLYDRQMTAWPKIRSNLVYDLFGDQTAALYWTRIFDLTYQGYINTWDYQWVYSCWVQSSLTILPNVNLVSNIGFGTQATHTKGASRVAHLPVTAIDFPLKHPEIVTRNCAADRFTQELYNHGDM